MNLPIGIGDFRKLVKGEYRFADKSLFVKDIIEAVSFDSYDSFVRSLSDGDVDKFKAYLSSCTMQSGSYFNFNSNTSEQIFHVFILGLVVGLREHYYIYLNQESGLGGFDVLFILKDINIQRFPI